MTNDACSSINSIAFRSCGEKKRADAMGSELNGSSSECCRRSGGAGLAPDEESEDDDPKSEVEVDDRNEARCARDASAKAEPIMLAVAAASAALSPSSA